jgi:hypothetical protein
VTTFGREILLIRRGLRDRVRLVGVMAGRASPGPLLVRATVFGSAVLALLLAFPLDLIRGGVAGVLLVVAALPALAPRSLFVTVALLVAVLGWLASTGAYGDAAASWRVIALAGALYVVHNSAALAAVLPYDTVVSPGVLAGWALRTAVVVVATAGFAVAVLTGVRLLAAGAYLYASIGGLVTAAAVAWLLAYLRRSPR